MKAMHKFGWRWTCDVEATAAAYANIAAGGSDECECDFCANFVGARASAYPAELLALLDELGVRHDREAEAAFMARNAGGACEYWVWFHFVGQIAVPADDDSSTQSSESVEFVPLTPSCHVRLSSECAVVDPAFAGHSVVELGVLMETPWMLATPFPD